MSGVHIKDSCNAVKYQQHFNWRTKLIWFSVNTHFCPLTSWIGNFCGDKRWGTQAWHDEPPQPHYPPRSAFFSPPNPHPSPTLTRAPQGSQTERPRAALQRNSSIIQLLAPQPPPPLILHLSIIKNEHLMCRLQGQKTRKTKEKASWF